MIWAFRRRSSKADSRTRRACWIRSFASAYSGFTAINSVAVLNFSTSASGPRRKTPLSIEGYSVTPALIERVQQGNWDPEHHDDDRKRWYLFSGS